MLKVKAKSHNKGEPSFDYICPNKLIIQKMKWQIKPFKALWLIHIVKWI